MLPWSAELSGRIDQRVIFDGIGAVVPDVWGRRLAHDPVVMAGQPRYAGALRSLRAIWIDAGERDEYFLDIGAAAFQRAVTAAGVPADRVYFELFDAGHAAIGYRYPLALAWLCQRLAGVMTIAHYVPVAPRTGHRRILGHQLGEKGMWWSWLRFARATVAAKAAGLSRERLRERLVHSQTTMGGILRHLVTGEQHWFGNVPGGLDLPVPFHAGDPDGDWRVSDGDDSGTP